MDLDKLSNTCLRFPLGRVNLPLFDQHQIRCVFDFEACFAAILIIGDGPSGYSRWEKDKVWSGVCEPTESVLPYLPNFAKLPPRNGWLLDQSFQRGKNVPRPIRRGPAAIPRMGRDTMRILFLSSKPNSPSFRFRVEQMLPFFADRGHHCDVVFLAESLISRVATYRNARHYDVVFLQRKRPSRWELALLRRNSRTLIYDFDDAVMLNGVGKTTPRRTNRFRNVTRAADLVVAGNEYLAEWAAGTSHNVCVLPTAIDANRFHPRLRSEKKESFVNIGWTGSRSTTVYLNEILPAIAPFGNRVQMTVIADTTERINRALLQDVPFQFVRWSPESETTTVAGFDIGLMPLPDNEWTRGKCGCKALQYMSMGIPAVCSPVGVNCQIIEHGRNGYLPNTVDDWQQTIAELIDDPTKRRTIGEAGQITARQQYALDVVGPQLVQAVETTAANVRPCRSSSAA